MSFKDALAWADSKSVIEPRPSDMKVKIVLYGKEGTGKTAMAMRFAYGKFYPELHSTIGASFNSKRVEVDGKILMLQLWDTAGSERFNSIMPVYLRSAKIVLICFDVPVIEEIEARIKKIHSTVGDTVKIFLVVTKTDISTTNRISYEDVQEYAAMNKYPLFYTSALNGLGIDELFTSVSRHALTLPPEEDKPAAPISLDIESTPKRTCCWS